MRTTTLLLLSTLACMGKVEPGRQALESGNFAQAEREVTKALADAERDGRKGEVSALLANLGVVYRHQARYERAEQMYLRALQTCGANCESALNNYAELLVTVGRFEEAGDLYLKSLKMAREAGRTPNWRLAVQLQNLGDLARRRGRYDEALQYLNEARDLLAKTGHCQTAEMASVQNNFAQYYMTLGRTREAEPMLLEAVELWRQTLGPNHPTYVLGLSGLGTLYFKEHKLSKAEPYFQRTLAMHLKSYGREHPLIAFDLNNLGMLAAARKQFPQAEHLFLEAVRIREKLGIAVEPVDQMRTFANLADLYVSEKRYQDAEKWYERVMDLLDRYPNIDDLNIAVSIEQYARMLAGQEQYALAEKLGTRAVRMRVRNSRFKLASQTR